MKPFFGDARRGVKNFERCNFKEESVTTSVGGTNYYACVKATMSCPKTEDSGSSFPVLENTNITHDAAKARKNAIEQLRNYCGAGVCQSCVYVELKSPMDVEEIRQKRAINDTALFRAKEQTAQVQLEALTAEMGALVAIEALNQAQQQTPEIDG